MPGSEQSTWVYAMNKLIIQQSREICEKVIRNSQRTEKRKSCREKVKWRYHLGLGGQKELLESLGIADI